MKLLGKVAFLLLLGGIWCQNNRNAKASGKSSKKSGGNQGGDVDQSPSVGGLTSGAVGSTRSTGSSGSSVSTGSSVSSRGNGSSGSSGSTGSTRGTGSTGGSGSSRGIGSSGGSGSSGRTRATGSSESSGRTRATGSSESSGSTRATGSSGSTRATGSSESSGRTRATGSSESSGSTRATGSSGSTRATGSSESSGSTRATGSSGSTRATGSSESSGSTRATGSSGSTRATGSSESSGSTRATGSSESSGSTRATGSSGSTKATGSSGSTRATGNSESSGSPRASGSSGSTKATGSFESSGSTRATGSSGSTKATGSSGSSRNTGGTSEAGREAAAGARAAGQQTDDMRLHFLKNNQVTCNDGTTAGFYLKEFRGSRRWLLFLEGGWCCHSKDTCDSRYQNIPRLMSSSGWPQTKIGTGILSSQAQENPHWHNANIVFIPYCSSDVWSGTGVALTPPPRPRQGREKERDPNTNATEYTFMGSLIIREVIKDLIPKGIKQAKVVMLSGTSAGGTGVLLNIERVASQLEQLGAEAQVRGLVDSGWFLESKQQRSPNCPETISCSPEDAIKIGLRLWNGVVPERCRKLHKRGEEWQCFFGHKLYSTLTSPLFVVQWLFDEEQLRVENIYMGGHSLSEEQWQYIQNLGRELKISLRDVTGVFAPSCLSHTVITRSNWLSFQVKGTSLPRALHCWDRSLEATRNNKTPAKGCPFHLVDTCQWPQCNPTCPALVDQATQQELTLIQMLVAMGLDLQKLGLDPQEDAVSLARMVTNGG